MIIRKLRFPMLFILALTLVTAAGCGKRNETNAGGAPSSASASPSASDSPAASPSPSASPSASGESAYHSDTNPVVTIEMDNGHMIKLELYPKVAPNTVNNFISLIKKGFYDGTIFHRVMPGFMIQGGDPQGNGTGGPGYEIKGEFTNNGFRNDLKHTRGVLSMARKSQPLDSAGSQFFIMVADAPSLDGDYAAFGSVIEGMDTVDEIVNQKIDPNDPAGTRPEKPMAIKKMTVDTKGVEYKEPEVIK
ncbi:peptidylprolyl isomerase [Cohnella sp. CFH 77786]|uniref:peptidylprolyl isomerase n=1 Tax=Cohnella sp. CFH 77786 TaxID=2662265 RepID=UPI001C6080AD|nr:peptidylprolyl isomerase [Cohnella sp. CFH 77786]MBW5446032.1 peptidylprolyl isomerase [Cohnella sp. CFH 77786]